MHSHVSLDTKLYVNNIIAIIVPTKGKIESESNPEYFFGILFIIVVWISYHYDLKTSLSHAGSLINFCTEA